MLIIHTFTWIYMIHRARLHLLFTIVFDPSAPSLLGWPLESNSIHPKSEDPNRAKVSVRHVFINTLRNECPNDQLLIALATLKKKNVVDMKVFLLA
jgi:hypothetical protein